MKKPLVREWEARTEALARQTPEAIWCSTRWPPAEAAHVRGLFAPDCQAGTLPSQSGYWLGDPHL